MSKFTLKDVAVNKRTINPYAGLPKKGSLFRIHPHNFIQSYAVSYTHLTLPTKRIV